MKTQEISRGDWPKFFDTFNHKNQGQPMLQVLGTKIGDQIEGRELVFEGITAELSDAGDQITIKIRAKPYDHFTHIIAAPAKVSVEQTERGEDVALSINSADGTSTRLRFPTTISLKPDYVVPKLPKIRDLMNGLDSLTYTRNGVEVDLYHSGTRYRPGPIYVRTNKQKRGTIREDGSFDVASDILDLLLDLDKNPRAVLGDSGRETGICAICGRELTNPESIARGMGPVCAERFD